MIALEPVSHKSFYQIAPSTTSSCSICKDLFTGVHPEVVLATSCGHLFHDTCLQEWFKRSATCPQCRTDVTEHETIRIYSQLNFINAKDVNNKLRYLELHMYIKDLNVKRLKQERKMAKNQAARLKKLLNISDREANKIIELATDFLNSQKKIKKEEHGKKLQEYQQELTEAKKQVNNLKQWIKMRENEMFCNDAEVYRLRKENARLKSVMGELEEEVAVLKYQCDSFAMQSGPRLEELAGVVSVRNNGDIEYQDAYEVRCDQESSDENRRRFELKETRENVCPLWEENYCALRSIKFDATGEGADNASDEGADNVTDGEVDNMTDEETDNRADEEADNAMYNTTDEETDNKVDENAEKTWSVRADIMADEIHSFFSSMLGYLRDHRNFW